MDNNSASFQMCLILLSFIVVGSQSQISVDQVTLYSSNVKRILRYLFGGGGACAKAKISVKKNCIRHFARFNFSRLSLAFFLNTILSCIFAGEK